MSRVDMSSDVSDTKDTRKRIRLVLRKSEQFHDIRCSGCGALLFRELLKSDNPGRTIEIKCRRCGDMNLS